MAFSTWATVESVHRLYNDIPIPLIWVCSFIFFTIAANWGVSTIVQSLDLSQKIDGRILKLFGGIIVFFLFWLFFFLPTNTHTFFYKRNIEDYTVSELKFTESKLRDLLNGGEAHKIIEEKKAEFIRSFHALKNNLEAEIDHPGHEGYRHRAEAVVQKMEQLLEQPIQRIELGNPTYENKQRFWKVMGVQLENLKDNKLKNFDEELVMLNSSIDEKEVNRLLAKIVSTEERIQACKEGLLSPAEAKEVRNEPTKATTSVMIASFQIIGKYSDDIQKYYPNAPQLLQYREPQIVQVENVITVWENFFRGLYREMNFWYYILMASLLDLSGFLLFHAAFKRKLN
jgi:hypothetical protein